MKTRLLFLSVAIGTFMTGPACAAPQTKKPLLMQTTTNGTVSPAYQTSTECAVFTNKIVSTKRSGGITGTTTLKITIKGNIRDVINTASAGQISSAPGPIGGPTQRYLAYSQSGEEIILKADGAQIQSNDAPEASTLINFLDLVCR